ncbi:DegT/DnrJ/EryC1/StrS family aminotransferase [Pseudomonas kitaguniensis]|uniref:DegT/DnrJ/EryC1/StrS family aminotransferase n=1 Tax=Pseudomonas kitaguniensis TaxID=2607908 RepID=UPI00156213E4
MQTLRSLLSGVDGITPVVVSQFSKPAYWVFLLFVDNREHVLSELKRKGVMASIVHQRNDIYSGFSAQACALPHTDYLQANVIGVPCGWWLEEDDVIQVASALKEAVGVTVINHVDSGA